MKSPFTYYLQLNTEHMTSHMTYIKMNMWYEMFVELSDETIREIHSKFIKFKNFQKLKLLIIY